MGQIYRFSVAALARDHEAATGRQPYFTRIDRVALMEHGFNGRSCQAWKDIDAARDRPLEFFPRYMTCVVDYGRKHADDMAWGTKRETRSDPMD